MDTIALTSTIRRILPGLVLTVASGGVQAVPDIGTEVDAICSDFNGTNPYGVNGTSGTTRCALCHDNSNRALRREPEWTWAQDPAGELQKNFCVVQGIIEKPATDITVSQGAAVDFAARGFSPKKGVGQVAFTWKDKDSAVILATGATATIPMPNAGNVTVILDTKDETNNESDQTPDQRTIAVSTAPTVASPNRYTVQAGNTLTVPAPGVLSNDTGTGTLSVVLPPDTNVTKGVLTLNPNGGFSYTPNADFTGRDSFTYKASNGVKTSDPVTVTINVTAAAPVATADRYQVRPGKVLRIGAPDGVLTNDTGSKPLTATLVANATKGKVTVNANGGFVYKPSGGSPGIDSFTYRVKNAVGSSAPVTVTLSTGACTDLDKDGYSAEGGDCGPIDCNDNRKAVNPGAKEICGNLIDDDCNRLADTGDPWCSGKDCIGKLVEQAEYQAEQVKIDQAAWAENLLTVEGRSNSPGATVTVTDPDTGAALGSTTVRDAGTWTVTKRRLTQAPCHVKVDILGASAQRGVDGAPAECSASSLCQ